MNARNVKTALLATLANLVFGMSSAEAQLIRKPSDLNVFDSNSGIRQGGRDFDRGTRQTGRDFDNARLDQMSRTPRAGRDFTKLYFQNNANTTISVAVRFMPFTWSDGRTSELQSLDARGNGWSTQAWYNLAPGQKMHVANTNNQIIYYYAEGGARKWAGQHFVQVGSGNRKQTLGFQMRYIGIDTPETWTINLNR